MFPAFLRAWPDGEVKRPSRFCSARSAVRRAWVLTVPPGYPRRGRQGARHFRHGQHRVHVVARDSIRGIEMRGLRGALGLRFENSSMSVGTSPAEAPITMTRACAVRRSPRRFRVPLWIRIRAEVDGHVALNDRPHCQH